jgi:hypothetical protein
MKAAAPMKAPTQEPTTVAREMGAAAAAAAAELVEASAVAEAPEESAVGLGLVAVVTAMCVEARFGAVENTAPGTAPVLTASEGAADAPSGSTVRAPSSRPLADTDGRAGPWRREGGRRPMTKEGRGEKSDGEGSTGAGRKEDSWRYGVTV